MAINISDIGQKMGAAFLGALQGYATDVESYAKSEGQKFATSLATIAELSALGKISKDESSLQLDLQRQASRAVFLAIEGIGILAAESAINAALAVVKDAVNTEIGFPLIA